MEKKLTAQGPKDRKSFTVTLPKEWIKAENLEKTRSVELKVVGNNVIIRPEKLNDKKLELNIDDYNNCIVKVLPGLYRSGVDELKIKSDDSRDISKITELIEKKLIGYEVIEQKKNFLTIRDITKESKEDFKVVFRRIFLMILELFEAEKVESIASLEKSIKKLINYCQRIIVKEGHTEFEKVPFYYLILDRLEKLSDEIVWYLTIKKKSNYPEFKSIGDMVRIAYELFYRFNPEVYNKFQHDTYLLKNSIKLKDKVEVSHIHLHNMARILNSLFADIFMLKIE